MGHLSQGGSRERTQVLRYGLRTINGKTGGVKVDALARAAAAAPTTKLARIVSTFGGAQERRKDSIYLDPKKPTIQIKERGDKHRKQRVDTELLRAVPQQRFQGPSRLSDEPAPRMRRWTRDASQTSWCESNEWLKQFWRPISEERRKLSARRRGER